MKRFLLCLAVCCALLPAGCDLVSRLSPKPVLVPAPTPRPHWMTCPTCKGRGAIPRVGRLRPWLCPTCDGRGIVWR